MSYHYLLLLSSIITLILSIITVVRKKNHVVFLGWCLLAYAVSQMIYYSNLLGFGYSYVLWIFREVMERLVLAASFAFLALHAKKRYNFGGFIPVTVILGAGTFISFIITIISYTINHTLYSADFTVYLLGIIVALIIVVKAFRAGKPMENRMPNLWLFPLILTILYSIDLVHNATAPFTNYTNSFLLYMCNFYAGLVVLVGINLFMLAFAIFVMSKQHDIAMSYEYLELKEILDNALKDE